MCFFSTIGRSQLQNCHFIFIVWNMTLNPRGTRLWRVSFSGLVPWQRIPRMFQKRGHAPGKLFYRCRQELQAQQELNALRGGANALLNWTQSASESLLQQVSCLVSKQDLAFDAFQSVTLRKKPVGAEGEPPSLPPN